MAQIENVLSESDESSSSAEETIVEVSCYTFESESESEFETSEYYDNSTNYGLFVNNDDDQEIFHDAIESASENFIKNHIDSQKDYDKSEVDHDNSEEKEHLVDKLIQKFNHKCQKRVEKANQQSKDFENQNKDLQEKYDVLMNQVNTFEEQNNEFNKQIKVLNEKNADLLAQTEVLQDQLKVKHVVIDTHTECQAQYAKLEEESEYMIRYSALFDNDKQHRKQMTDYTMADMNIPANDVPADQAPAIAPPTRTDDQILPLSKWVHVGKSNYVLDVLRSQRNLIFKVVVAIMKNTNFCRAFTASSTITAIYIQQFWDTMRAILSMINMCLTGKTAGHDRPRHLVLQIFKDNVLGNLKFVRKDGREVFGMPIPDALLTDAIIRAPYYGRYMAYVAEYQRYLDGEHGMADEEAVPKSPKATKVT
nr:hypothetical protein [Tanacetum cinerariifolium]